MLTAKWSIGILKKTAEILGLPFEKVKTNMHKYANTSAGTIPILLDEVNREGLIKKNDSCAFFQVQIYSSFFIHIGLVLGS